MRNQNACSLHQAHSKRVKMLKVDMNIDGEVDWLVLGSYLLARLKPIACYSGFHVHIWVSLISSNDDMYFSVII